MSLMANVWAKKIVQNRARIKVCLVRIVDLQDRSKNARFWKGQKKLCFRPPQTPFKTEGVVEGFWAGFAKQGC